MLNESINLPPQQLPFSKKNKEWRKKHLDWADSKTFFNYNPVRKSVMHKKINYDLLNGKLHMSDLELIVNPENIQAGFIPERIQHFPIMNSKLNILKGEEFKRIFDARIVITNPNSITEISENKNEEVNQKLKEWVSDSSISEDEASSRLDKLADYMKYSWKDKREIRANYLLNHYYKELNMPVIFNAGFVDAETVGEEIYQTDIVGGEPTLERLNPLKVRVFRSGFSNKIEDADMIVIEDYWSPGKIIDNYYDSLSKKDMEYIENIPFNVGQGPVDSMGNVDERMGFVNNYMIGDEITSNEGFFWDPMMSSEGIGNSLLPYDMAGNVRVLRVYWKSRRRIKKVKSYNPETGEEEYNFYPETYIINKDNGEEEDIYYINEAWEGTKIGTDIYINMRPRIVQYNRLSNPSRCHFGIVGSVYNLNDSRPFSLVDMMKPYNYYYDVIHDRLNKLLARNWGNLVELDFSKKPSGWEVDKWMYYAKTMGLYVIDSFNEGRIGASTGKLAGAMNNASRGVIPTSDGNLIQQYINLLSFIKEEMSEISGISKQREGQIDKRETMGGVERATVQSSHITEWLFVIHDDVKKRALEAFIETAKIALKGRTKKFSYILPDGSEILMEIDGDEFAESDYGLVVDTSDGSQRLNQKLDTLAEAALNSHSISFSSIMKLYSSCSLTEKQKIIEREEQAAIESQSKQQDQEMQARREAIESANKQKEAELDQKEKASIRDNETKLAIAQMGISMDKDTDEPEYSQESKDKLMQKMKEVDEKLKLDREKLAFEKKKHEEDNALKDKISSRQHKAKVSS